ncbi:MAG: KH domain-containing protein [Patescibacteria group bacterium]
MMAEKNTDQEFVEHIVKSLVNHPDDVIVERKIDEMGVLLTLKVNPADMALVIGKNGSTARAIRTLVWIIGLRNRARVNFKIEEPEGSTRSAIAQGGEQGRTMRMKRGEMESVVDELKS